jgi:GAF domain-containing protein
MEASARAALPLGFKACWSTPIRSGDRVVATFPFYLQESRGPSNQERRIVDACIHLCAIAIEREERVRERQRLTYIDVLTGLPNRARYQDLVGLHDQIDLGRNTETQKNRDGFLEHIGFHLLLLSSSRSS